MCGLQIVDHKVKPNTNFQFRAKYFPENAADELKTPLTQVCRASSCVVGSLSAHFCEVKDVCMYVCMFTADTHHQHLWMASAPVLAPDSVGHHQRGNILSSRPVCAARGPDGGHAVHVRAAHTLLQMQILHGDFDPHQHPRGFLDVNANMPQR